MASTTDEVGKGHHRSSEEELEIRLWDWPWKNGEKSEYMVMVFCQNY